MPIPSIVLTEPVRPGEYLVSEANGSISREVAIITGGVDLFPGTVLGQITASGSMVMLNPSATDGSQNASAVLFGPVLASKGDTAGTITARNTEVNGLLLTWPAGITAAQQASAMASLAAAPRLIIVRT